MAQSSGPISQGTTTDRQFTDVLWRDLFGDEAGVIGDINGSAYFLALSSGSDVAQVGSANQISTAKVAGFAHRIPSGSPEGITVPVASGSARTDILALRYDPAFTGQPGPVRLVRIAGTSSALPVYDDSAPGIEDLPLWSITRSPGQNLSQATVQRLFPRIGPTMDLPTGAPLPLSSPLGTTLRQGTATYYRVIGSSGLPVWSNVQSPVTQGRVVINTGKVAADSGLMTTVTLPASAVPTSVVLVALGRFGFATADRRGSWDFDSTSSSVPIVKDDPTGARVFAHAGEWATVHSTMMMTVPANVAAPFRLVYRGNGDAYNRGAVTWTRIPT